MRLEYSWLWWQRATNTRSGDIEAGFIVKRLTRGCLWKCHGTDNLGGMWWLPALIRLVGAQRYDRVTPILWPFHWLPSVPNSKCCLGPGCLQGCLRRYQPSPVLHSARKALLRRRPHGRAPLGEPSTGQPHSYRTPCPSRSAGLRPWQHFPDRGFGRAFKSLNVVHCLNGNCYLILIFICILDVWFGLREAG